MAYKQSIKNKKPSRSSYIQEVNNEKTGYEHLSKYDQKFLKENEKYIDSYEADTGNTIMSKKDVNDFEDWLQYYSNEVK